MKKYFVECILFFLVFGGFTGIVKADIPRYGLVAEYLFEENSNDSSGNMNHGVEYGGIVFINGRNGQAIFFDGVDDRVQIDNQVVLKYDYTLSFWIKLEEEGKSYILGCQTWGNQGGNIYYGLSTFGVDGESEQLYFSFGNGSGGGPGASRSYSIDYIIDTHEWYHVVLVASDHNMETGKVYINGNEVSFDYDSGSALSTDFSKGNMDIGTVKGDRRGYGSDDGLGFFHGALDQMRFYNRSLSESEIWELYHEGEICEDRYDEGYESGKQYCINNPEVCGIEIGGDYQEGYNKGFSDGQNTCDNLVQPENCATLENNFNITMPCIDVFGTQIPINLERFTYPSDPFGYYWKLNLQ